MPRGLATPGLGAPTDGVDLNVDDRVNGNLQALPGPSGDGLSSRTGLYLAVFRRYEP